MALPKKKLKEEVPFNQSERCEELKCLLKHCLNHHKIDYNQIISQVFCDNEEVFLQRLKDLISDKNIIKCIESLVNNDKNNPCKPFSHGNA